MMKLLRMLDSPREKELWKLVKTKGGVKACMEDENILKELAAAKASQMTTASGTVDSVKLGEVKQSLKEELDKSLSSNFAQFEKKLTLQTRQLEMAMDRVAKRESDRVISAITSGPHDRVVDKDLHKIWKEMGWRSSVKARHFVLAVHDYFIQKVSAAAAQEQQLETGTVYSDDGRVAPSVVSEALPKAEHGEEEDDSWALEYINLSRVPAILEAFDDDGSGFINVVEVNQFTSSRPKDWRVKIGSILDAMYGLLEQGEILPTNRHVVDHYVCSDQINLADLLVRSVARYTEENNTTTLEEKIKPYMDDEEKRLRTNLEGVGWNIDGFDTLNLVTGPGRIERHLFPLLYLVLDRHLRILRLSNEKILDSSELSAPQQTLYIIFEAALIRMRTLLSVLKQRSSNPKVLLGNVAFGMFKLLNDPSQEEQLEEGDDYNDFPKLYDDGVREEELVKGRPRVLNCDPLRTVVELVSYKQYADLPPPPPLTETAMELEDEDALTGVWTGHCYRYEDGTCDGLMELHVTEAEGDKVRGVGLDKFGFFDFDGQMTATEEGDKKVTFKLIYRSDKNWRDPDEEKKDEEKEKEGEKEEGEGGGDNAAEKGEGEGEAKGDEEGQDKGEEAKEAEAEPVAQPEPKPEAAPEAAPEPEHEAPRTGVEEAPGGAIADHVVNEQPPLTANTTAGAAGGSIESPPTVWVYGGTFDTSAGTISGQWGTEGEDNIGSFSFSRRPIEAYQFKYTEQQFNENKALARWKYALSVVRHQVQKKSWSWSYMKERMTRRKRFIDIRSRRDVEVIHAVHPDNVVKEEEIEELNTLEQTLLPQDASGYICDGCSAELIDARMICLECIAPDFVDNMDFCDLCFDVSKEDRGFDHNPSHDSLVVYEVMHKRMKKDKVETARNWVSWARSNLDEGNESTLCGSCSSPVKLPYPQVYICEDCHKKENPTYTNGTHKSTHPVIRISEPIVSTKRAVEDVVEDLDSRLTKDLAEVSSRMEKLEESVKEYESGVNQRIAALEVMVQQRLSKVEELLLQVLKGPSSHSYA
ncbi:hypothetical protein FRC17_010740 [Serendipita sp. 399]|nr:hypothetical protein FRC17_010740 [Serendipita sp. 399]